MLRLKVYDWFEKFRFLNVAPWQRETGKKLAQIGLRLQEPYVTDDQLVPSLRKKAFKGVTPVVEEASFIAPNACVIGEINLQENSALWYGTVLRGDQSSIQIGRHTVIQDLTSIHAKKYPIYQGITFKLVIMCMLGLTPVWKVAPLNTQLLSEWGKFKSQDIHKIQPKILKKILKLLLIFRATVKEGASVKTNGVVAAGSVVTEGSQIESYQVWAGNPAQYLRDVTPQEKEALDEHQQEQIELGKIHAEENDKSLREIINDKDREMEAAYCDAEDLAIAKLKELGFPTDYDDEDYIEQRVFLKDQGTLNEDQFWRKTYDPYEQDLFNFPDSNFLIVGFKIYGENFDYYEQAKKRFETESQEPYQFSKDRVAPKNQEPWNNKYDF